MNDRQTQALSFGAAATAYERGRPPYPTAAVDWMLPIRAHRVLDLGAGTGKLTRQLTGRGLDIVAVEPVVEMRTEFSRVLPDIPILAGTAEHIPLNDGSVDAVLVAQAWHWVDAEVAVPEVARVLAAGGTLALVWNERDQSVPWVAGLSRLMAHLNPSNIGDEAALIGTPFGATEHAEFRWSHRVSLQDVVDMMASRSYVITMETTARDALLTQIRDYLVNHPDIDTNGTFDLPYLTHCHRARLSGSVSL